MDADILYVILGAVLGIGGGLLTSIIKDRKRDAILKQKDIETQKRKSAIIIYRIGKVHRDIYSIVRNAHVTHDTIDEDNYVDKLHNQVHEQFTLYLLHNKDKISALMADTNKQIENLNEFDDNKLHKIKSNLNSARDLLIWIDKYFVSNVRNDPIPEDSIFPESSYDDTVSWKIYHDKFTEQVKAISTLTKTSAEMIKT